MPVISIVRGAVEAAKVGELEVAYQEAIGEGLPDGIDATCLARAASGEVAVITVWRDQAALDAMRASGEEPLARRLIRTAGGTPTAEFLEVIATAAR